MLVGDGLGEAINLTNSKAFFYQKSSEVHN